MEAMCESCQAVREHQVPKIDTPHGKERGREEGRERERNCRVGIHIYETKSPDSRTVTMINYRLEIMVDRQLYAQKHTCTPAHKCIHRFTNSIPCRVSEKSVVVKERPNAKHVAVSSNNTVLRVL